MTDTRLRILLADDHVTVRQGLKMLIESQGDMTVVSEASDGTAAVEQARTLRPDVVVMDISMPGMNGLVATRTLKQIQPDSVIVILTRHGDDVVFELGISFPQAALGAEIEVPTLNGTTTLEVPPGTQTGDVLRLAGRGVPRLGGGPRGDQLAQIAVWVPTRLSSEERRALEQLADSENFVPPKSGKGFWSKVKEAFTT